MKQIQIILLLAVTLCNNDMLAQEIKDSTKTKKNEIGINVIPFFLMLNNSESDNIPLFHVFYKRQLKGNWYGRLSISIMTDRNPSGKNEQPMITALPGTKMAIEYTKVEKNNYLQYFAGIEKRWGKGKVRQFAGLDIGYSNYKTSSKRFYGIRNFISNADANSYFPDNRSGSDSVIFNYRYTYNAIALNPFYGLQFNFSKRFFLSAQVGYNLQLITQKTKKIVENRNFSDYINRNITTMDISTSGIVNNISICYRF